MSERGAGGVRSNELLGPDAALLAAPSSGPQARKSAHTFPGRRTTRTPQTREARAKRTNRAADQKPVWRTRNRTARARSRRSHYGFTRFKPESDPATPTMLASSCSGAVTNHDCARNSVSHLRRGVTSELTGAELCRAKAARLLAPPGYQT